MKKKFTFLMAAMMLLTMILPWKAVGQERDSQKSTLTFTAACGGSGTADDGAEWTVTSDGAESTYDKDKGIHYGTGSAQVKYIQLETSAILGNITKVVVNASTASGVSATVGVTVGGSSFGGDPQSLTSSAADYTFEGSASGDIVVLITKPSKATKALYCKSIEVTYTPSHNLTYSATTGGSITSVMNGSTSVSSGGKVVEGTILNIEAAAESGYVFAGWTQTGTGNSFGNASNLSTTFTMGTANATITANFEETPTDPYFTASDVILAYNVTAGSIAYTVNNPVQGGVVTAEITGGNEGSWLSRGDVTSTSVPLTCSANNMGQRAATVTLTYTYNTNQTVTKDVTVTQDPAKFTITFHGNGGKAAGNATEYTQVNVVYNTETALTANAFTRDGYLFNNWNTEENGSGYSYNNQANVTLTGNLHLYAQWTIIPTYTLVTSVDQIVPGAHYVIACVKDGETTNSVVMGTYNSGNYRNKVDINTSTYLSGNTITQFENLCEFIISGYTDNWTIYDGANYLQYGDKKLYNSASVTNDTKWKISIAEGTSIATITAASETSYSIQYNSGSPRFACYSSNQQKVYLYKKDNDNNIHPYSSSEYSSEVTIKDDITLSSDYTLTVANGGVLTLTGSVSCSNASWLVVEDGGQLIIPSTGSKTDVKATFQKNITHYSSTKDNYYLIANPTTDVIDPEDVDEMVEDHVEYDYDLYYFDEEQTGEEWRNYRQVAFNLVNGKGYLYAKSSDITLEFPGTVPPGTTAGITLSRLGSGTYAGFNLVGNPLSNNVTSMKIGESSCSYYKVNSLTGVFAVSTDPIIVGEAFMVEAPSDGETLRLNPSAKDEDGFTNEVIRLEVSNSKFTDVAYVYFGNHLPLTKINHLNDEAPMLYIHNENSDKAVEVYNNRGEVKSVDVNFEAKTTGTYNISAKMMKGEVKYMHLYDRLTGIDTDLLMDDYSFIGAKGDIAGRFILNLESVDNNSSTGSDTFAYQSGNDIIVNGEGTLEVYDVTGRKVMATTINGVETINGLNSGVYIFRIIGETLRTQKIVVR